MRVCVLGAGVVGLTTAWSLAEAGCDVVVIDREQAAGLGTSRGNGAQLSYAFVAPFASPATLRHLPALLADRDGPLRFRPGLDPDFARWSFGFLRACRTATVRRTVAAQLGLAALSRQGVAGLTEALGLEFGLRTAGKLVVYRDAAHFNEARAAVATEGQAVLSARESLDLEPALRIGESRLAGGIYTASEQVGDCGAFCDGLAAALRQRNNVTWLMGRGAEPVILGNEMVAVAAGGEQIEADTFVLALGAGSAAFARKAGFRLPIYPMKGYSLTLRPVSPEAALTHSVTDADRKVVFAPLHREDGPLIRAAGAADLVGHDLAIDPVRLDTVRRAARDAVDVDWDADTQPWAGLRPATPNSRPVIGPAPIRRLFLNTGHGALGWTLACGSARLATDLLLRRPPAVDPADFALP
jgi:D-amino-acid dehydrogenase